MNFQNGLVSLFPNALLIILFTYASLAFLIPRFANYQWLPCIPRGERPGRSDGVAAGPRKSGDLGSCLGDEINPSKWTILSNHRCRSPRSMFYSLCKTVLKSTDEAKYLGVSITSDMEWSQHIQQISSKSNSTLGLLRRNLSIFPKNRPLSPSFDHV